MRNLRVSRRNAAWAIALICALLSAGLAAVEAFRSDEDLLRAVEADVRADFRNLVAQWRDKLALQPDAELAESGNALVFKYDWEGVLLDWSGNAFVPSEKEAARLLRTNRDELLLSGRRAYFAVKSPKPAAFYIALLPLRVDYPINNEYLKDYLYLGRYNARRAVREAASRFRFSTQASPLGVNIAGADGELVYSATIDDPAPFRQRRRSFALAFAGLALAAAAFGLHWGLRQRALNPALRWLALALALAGVRGLLLYFKLPGAYAQTALFSPRLLALNELSPSMGDLTLNTLIGLTLVYQLVKLPDVRALAERLDRAGGRVAWVGGLALAIGAVGGGFALYIDWFGMMARNSVVPYQFIDVSNFNEFSALFYLNAALLLAAFFFVQYFFIRLFVELQQLRPAPYYAVAAVGGACLLLIQWLLPAAMYVTLMTGGAYLAVLLLIGHLARGRLRFSLLHVVFLSAVFALTVSAAASGAYFREVSTNMARYAERYSVQRDLMVEYQLDDVVYDVRRDAALWENDSLFGAKDEDVTRNIIQPVLSRHLQPYIKGYDFQVFLLDRYGARVDWQNRSAPYVKPFREQNRDTTLSRFFYLYPHPANVTQSIYAGTFQVDSVPEPLYLHVELWPKQVSESRLYPRLLLDEQVTSRKRLPAGYEMAFYYDQRYLYQTGRRWNYADYQTFPLALPLPPGASEERPGAAIAQNGRDTYEYMLWRPNGQAVYVRAQRPDVFNQITAASLLFYFFITLYFLWRLPRLSRYVSKDGRVALRRLALRVQLALAALSLAPVVVILAVTAGFFQDYFYAEAGSELRTRLDETADFIRGETDFLRKLQAGDSAEAGEARRALSRAGDLLGADVNIYSLEGELLSATQPRIYLLKLTSRRIQPEAYRKLASGRQSRFITEERIGDLKFLSGYAPLFNRANEQIAILNIPFLSQQDALEYQARRFLAYIVNVYVVLFLVVILVGVFITRKLTRPLEILRQRIEQTTLGLRNEPVEWSSKDEIGEIIRSYNQMLAKLEESRVELARTQRESAWQGMAQQIAHEIKNPLTPMKLRLEYLLHKSRGQETIDAEKFRETADVLLGLIDSLREKAENFARFSRMPQLNIQTVRADEIVHNTGNLYLDADEAEVTVTLPEHPVYVRADKTQLGDVLLNLVRNSLQAMEQRGKVNISLYVEGENAVIKVSDNGKGIPEAVQKKIFEPGYTTKTSGSGLGLAICRRYIEGMGGAIRFESREGEGTAFYLAFRVLSEEEAAQS